MRLPWFIPSFRDVPYDKSLAVLVEDDDYESNSQGSLTDFKKEVVIKEYRDEAARPWWKFFDEFEYRYTKEEAAKHKWWKWYEEGTTPEEKRLLLKLDILIAFYAFLGYWVKYIDSSNLNNAYVSGMKEDLHMKGNDLINTQVLFTVGNIIFEVPWLFLLPRISITYVLTSCELGWAVLTLCLHRVENVASLKAIRFLVGATEAAYFPCIHYILANWYKPTEIGRRGGFFYMGQFLGILTSGLLQSATFTHLDGVNGLAGWRWMYIIDGIISFGVAIIGFLVIPGTPTRCYSIWLTDDEIKLARKRMSDNHTDISPNVNSFFDKKTWKNILTSWHFWILSIAQIFGFNTNSASSGSFAIWLKSLDRYDIGRINNFTAIPPALGILWIVIVCFGADVTRKRFLLIIFSFLMNFICTTMLAIWDISETAKWVGFCLAYWSWSQSSVFNPLINDILRHNQNQRSIEWMIIYIIGLQSSAWISKLTWQTVDSPRYLAGFTSCAVFSIAFIITISIAYFFYKRDERSDALNNGIYLYNSKTGPIPEAVLNETPSFEEIVDDHENDKAHDVLVVKTRSLTNASELQP